MLVGQLGIVLPGVLKQVFFLLFLFSIGYRTGPQFFRGLKRDGLAQATLAVVFALVALGAVYVVARVLGFDAGTAAGLFAGALTQSATIGTAGDTINHLAIAKEAQNHLANQIAVAFAATYLVGVTGAAWFLAQLAPRILGVDLAAECRTYEEKQSGEMPELFAAWRMFEIRTFRLNPNSIIAGRSIKDAEQTIGGARVYIARVRRNGTIEKPEPSFVLKADDVIGIGGRHEILINHADKFGVEVADRDLVQGSIDAVDVVVTQKTIDGISLVELGDKPFARGVFLRGLSRSGIALPVMPATVVERGDVLSIVGAPEATKLASDAMGLADRVTDVTDMAFVGLGIVIGAIVGIPAIRFGALEIGLSQSVGVLLGGIVFGWLRAVRPVFGRIPTPTLWIFESLGLTGFVAVVGLAAGPDFVHGLQESGLRLIFVAIAVVIIALFATLMAGHFLFHLHPGILLGACAGACTATPALAAVQEAAKSSVPTLGYGVSYAVGNVLLALGGKVIVLLLV